MLNSKIKISGIQQNSNQSNLPVMLPYKGVSSGDPIDLLFSRWIVSSSPYILI